MFKKIILMALVLGATGCATAPKMAVSPNQTITKPSAQESQVIFMRSSFVGSAIDASLFDVTNGNLEFIGIISNATKVAYTTKPGKHTFMVVSEAADFMEADVAAGKNYYSVVTPRMGVWAARFSLWPIKNDKSAEYNTSMPEFSQWLAATKLTTNTPASREWFQKNKAKIMERHNKYMAEWKSTTGENLKKRTLDSQDSY